MKYVFSRKERGKKIYLALFDGNYWESNAHELDVVLKFSKYELADEYQKSHHVQTENYRITPLTTT